MRSVPLMMGMAMISVGWAMGGGAAQILFALFGEQVFHRGASGIGSIWGFAGIGLLIGGAIAHITGRSVSFAGYKRTVTLSYLLHGAAYMLFSQAGSYAGALVFMMFSRVGMAVTSVLNNAQLLRHTPGPVPRARLQHHGIHPLERHDRLDGGRGHRVPVRRSAHHRAGGGRIRIAHRYRVGMARLERTPARAIIEARDITRARRGTRVRRQSWAGPVRIRS